MCSLFFIPLSFSVSFACLESSHDYVLVRLVTYAYHCRYLYYNNFGSIVNMFNNLQTINSYFYIYGNQRLTLISNSFNSLSSVSSYVYLYNNPVLTSVTNSFNGLTSLPNFLYVLHVLLECKRRWCVSSRSV